MKLDHMFGGEAGHLMQVVDVLGDYGGNLARPVERGQGTVTAAGFGRRKSRLHRKAPPPGFVAGILAGDEFIERDRPVAAPQPARRTEVGNAAFGRNAGAGEGNDAGGFGDHVAELFHAAAKIRCDHGLTSETVAVLTIARPLR